MRHTWHADQETTVLLHFCHHLPTDFFHIPIWLGGLDFLSISSPLTVSRQKAPLVRFLARQLITQSGRVLTPRLQARQVLGIDFHLPATSLSSSPASRGLSSELSEFLGPGMTNTVSSQQHKLPTSAPFSHFY